MKRVRELNAVETRVLGVLLEKELATPEYYPMTVKAVIAAANQKSNREPVTQLGEGEVVGALDALRHDVLVWRGSGARVERWSHALGRRLDLTPASQAVLALLMLRGPQTQGELRARSNRLHDFEDLEEVRDTLRSLAAGEDPLVVELRRSPGQKEARSSHLLGDGEVPPAVLGQGEGEATPATAEPELARRVAELERRLAALAERVAELES